MDNIKSSKKLKCEQLFMFEEKSTEKELINEKFLEEIFLSKINPNKAYQLYNDEFKTSYNYGSFLTMIKRIYHVAWDKDKKKYYSLDYVKDTVNSNNHENKNYNHIIDLLHGDEIKTKDSVNLKSEDRADLNTCTKADHADLDTILNYLQTLNKEIGLLRTKLNKIENYFKDNSPQKRKELTEEFINIFSSNSKRVSVNINEEIKNRIIKKMDVQKQIKNNQSAAINTALLITLFNDDQ